MSRHKTAAERRRRKIAAKRKAQRARRKARDVAANSEVSAA